LFVHRTLPTPNKKLRGVHRVETPIRGKGEMKSEGGKLYPKLSRTGLWGKKGKMFEGTQVEKIGGKSIGG